MKFLQSILFLSLFFCFSLKAEERSCERVYVYTDKDCYVSGEDIWLKFYVVDGNFQPSVLSKVGYVEICDTEKPQIQLKLALEKGQGAGRMRIPMELPSGVYQLSGYTRYMRNEGENVFFKKLIAVVNAGQQFPDSKRFRLIEKYDTARYCGFDPQPLSCESTKLSIKTDRNQYGNRNKVLLSLDNIPDNTANLVISVSRNDSIALLPEVKPEWLKPVTGNNFQSSQQWLPEYEGHIVTGRLVPEPQEQLLSGIALMGNDIRYFNGQLNLQTGISSFYTAGIYGKQQIVTSATSLLYDKVPYRVDLLTPFDESLPDSLPVLQIYPNEKSLLERYIGVQIQEKMDNDSLDNSIQTPNYCSFQPILSYDLDEYTRFSTISETILEFVSFVHVTKVKDKRIISAYSNNLQRNGFGTLVLLDGIPIYDHEEILRYNPMFIKKINIYEGGYMFGGENFEYIVSFVTRDGNLPFFQLGDGAQLFNYDFPQLPSLMKIPDYSIDEIRNSRKPDFRHTLYWNPFVEFTTGQPVNLSFYTSDLCGEFKVTVEGITTDGKIIHGVSYFQVSTKN
ncbi:MAG: hypothetical protein FWD60_02565 [Candidatus Azobacteroides sp.]|nr:hypothetical protein [Candidatus Azobacteroides sp.]